MKKQRGKIVSFRSERLSVSWRLRSGLELAVANLLDSERRVVSMTYERFRVPWMQRQKQRVYIPDFAIRLENAGCLVIEVKPEAWTRRTPTQQKARAAIIHLEPLQIGFLIWSEVDLERYQREGISWERILAGRDLCRRNLVLGGRSEQVWLSGLLAASFAAGERVRGKNPVERSGNMWRRADLV